MGRLKRVEALRQIQLPRRDSHRSDHLDEQVLMVGADEGSFDGYSDDAVRPYSGGDGDPVVRRSTGTFRACEKPARPCFVPRRRESGPPSRLGSRYLLTLAITPPNLYAAGVEGVRLASRLGERVGRGV